MPYILESLYKNYRSVNDLWKQFFIKRAWPDVPEQETNGQTETSKKKFFYSNCEGEIPVTVGNTRSQQERYLHWQQSRPKLENQ